MNNTEKRLQAIIRLNQLLIESFVFVNDIFTYQEHILMIRRICLEEPFNEENVEELFSILQRIIDASNAGKLLKTFESF